MPGDHDTIEGLDGASQDWRWKRAPWLTAALACLLLLAWELLVRILHVPAIVVPPPSLVANALWQGFMRGDFATNLAVTVAEVLGGFVAGTALGVALGVVIGLSPLMERVVYPFVVAFQTVPKVAVAPLVVIWFGYGLNSKIIITATIAFFPVLANTIAGLRSPPSDQVEMLRAHTATDWQIFTLLRLPHALPYIFVGMDVAILLSVIGAIVGEFVGSNAGLGYLILQQNFNFDMPGVFAVLILLSVVGVILHAAVVIAQRRIVFWADTHQGHGRGR